MYASPAKLYGIRGAALAIIIGELLRGQPLHDWDAAEILVLLGRESRGSTAAFAGPG